MKLDDFLTLTFVSQKRLFIASQILLISVECISKRQMKAKKSIRLIEIGCSMKGNNKRKDIKKANRNLFVQS